VCVSTFQLARGALARRAATRSVDDTDDDDD
jgi:hypothetical protein